MAGREGAFLDRRKFISTLAGGLLAAPLAAEAQGPSKSARIGVLFPSIDNAVFRAYLEGFRRRMTELGYDDGRNLTLLYEFGEDQRARLVMQAARLRDLHPDAIVAIAPAGVEVASKATKDIPVIAVDHGTDPIAAGYMKTLARPGGNVTASSWTSLSWPASGWSC